MREYTHMLALVSESGYHWNNKIVNADFYLTDEELIHDYKKNLNDIGAIKYKYSDEGEETIVLKSTYEPAIIQIERLTNG